MGDGLLHEIAHNLSTEEVTVLLYLSEKDTSPQNAISRKTLRADIAAQVAASGAKFTDAKCYITLMRLESALLIARQTRQQGDLWYLTSHGKDALNVLG